MGIYFALWTVLVQAVTLASPAYPASWLLGDLLFVMLPAMISLPYPAVFLFSFRFALPILFPLSCRFRLRLQQPDKRVKGQHRHSSIACAMDINKHCKEELWFLIFLWFCRSSLYG